MLFFEKTTLFFQKTTLKKKDIHLLFSWQHYDQYFCQRGSIVSGIERHHLAIQLISILHLSASDQNHF